MVMSPAIHLNVKGHIHALRDSQLVVILVGHIYAPRNGYLDPAHPNLHDASFPNRSLQDPLNIPSGFCDVALTGVLSLQTICLIRDLAATAAQSIDPKQANIDETLELKIQTILQDLHSPLILRVTETERILCHGLVVYCYLLRLRNSHHVITGYCGSVLKSFAEATLRRTPSLTARGPKCHVWTLMTIVQVLQHGHTPGAQWKLVLQQVFIRWPEFRQWDELERYLNTLFWDESMGELLRMVYEDAINEESYINRDLAVSQTAKEQSWHPDESEASQG